MKKEAYKKLSFYLPFMVGAVVLLFSFDAQAGKIWDWVVSAAKETIAAKLGIDLEDNCKVPGGHTGCIFCDMFKILYNAGSHVAGVSYSAFSSSLGELVLTFLAVSLAVIILKNVASMGAKDPGTLLNDLIKKAFVCAAIYIIVTRDYYYIINLTLTPIFEAGLGFAGAAGGTPGSCASAGGINGFAQSAGSGASGGMPASVGNMIVCAVEAIEHKIYTLFDFGEWAFCRGNGPDRLWVVFPHPVYIIDGVLLYIGGVFFIVSYPWIMGDAVLQLGIAMALVPFAIAGYAFDGTKGYLGKTFSWILHSLFTFMFMAILINCILGYINSVLSAAVSGGISDPMAIGIDGGSATVSGAAADPKVLFTDPVNGVAFYGPNMLMIIFILVIGWTYMPTITDLAKEFSKGSGLAASAAIGTAVRDQMEKQGGKALDYAGKTAWEGSKAAARVTTRRTQSLARVGLKKFVNAAGHDNGMGGKTFAVGGRYMPKFITRGLQFSTMTNADGSSYLQREFKSITGRKHVMVSDKYMTIKKEYDKNGREVGSHVEFKHNFAKKYLFDKNGNLNVKAVETLLNSDLAQRPEYKKAIMAQIAVTTLEKRGHRVGKYYNSRNILFDPNDPSKILFEQDDHSGRKTRVEMNINMETGQIFTRYDTKTTKTNTMRRGKIIMAKNASWIAKRFSKNNNDTVNFLGMQYTLHTDPASGESYYTKKAKKYLFFGNTIEKEYKADGTERRITQNQESQQNHQEKLQEMAYKVTGGMPNAHGGLTKKGLFHTYESRVDQAGNVTFSKQLRSGWNLKNYYRVGKTTVKTAAKIAIKMPLTVATYPLMHPSRTIKGIFHPARSLSAIAAAAQGAAQGIAADYKNDWSTGNVKTYSQGGKTVRSSRSGKIVDQDLMDKTVYRSKDGDKIVTDNITNETKRSHKYYSYESFVDNGQVSITMKGLENFEGGILSEVTKFQYAANVQKGHDTILEPRDGHQVVERDGTVASDLDADTLLFGMPSYVKDGILAEGRRRETNKMATQFGSGFVQNDTTANAGEDQDANETRDNNDNTPPSSDDNTSEPAPDTLPPTEENTDNTGEAPNDFSEQDVEPTEAELDNKVVHLEEEFNQYLSGHPEITDAADARQAFMRSRLNPWEFALYCERYH